MSQHGFFSFASRGFSYTSWGVVGSPGWFRDSGDFGIAMTVFFPLAFAFAFALKDYWGRYKRWFFYFLPITGMVTIVATSSRGAQLGMVAIGIWFLLKSGKGIKAMIGILVVGWACMPFFRRECWRNIRLQEMTGHHKLDWSTGNLEWKLFGINQY